MGGITIEDRVFIAAGSIVTKDVPTRHIVTGTNNLTPLDDWPGECLSDLMRLWSKPG